MKKHFGLTMLFVSKRAEFHHQEMKDMQSSVTGHGPFRHGHQLRKDRSWLAMALILGSSFTLYLASTTLVHAGTCTPFIGCGVVANDSSWADQVAGGSQDSQRGWCWSSPDNKPRYDAPWSTSGAFSCTVNKVWVYSRQSSSAYIRDTDSFSVAYGCKIKWYGAWGVLSSNPVTEDRRGLSRTKWIKLEDGNTVHITSQNCSGTPAKYYAKTWATAAGYQDQFCYGNGGWSNPRCDSDGNLYAQTNYFYCRVWGYAYPSESAAAKNHWWLLTDLDSVNSGRDGRSFVSAYFLGGAGNASNDTARYQDSSGSWHDIPDC